MSAIDCPSDLRRRKWTSRNRDGDGGRGRLAARLARALLAGGVLSCLAVAVADAIDGAALQKGPSGNWHIVLPSDLMESMRHSVPRFTIAADSAYVSRLRVDYPCTEHTAPFALIRDINGDAREDVILDGREGVDRMVYLAVSHGHAYRWIEIPSYGPAHDSVWVGWPRCSALRWLEDPTGRPGVAAFGLHPTVVGRTDLVQTHSWSDSSGLDTRVQIRCGVALPSKSKE